MISIPKVIKIVIAVLSAVLTAIGPYMTGDETE